MPVSQLIPPSTAPCGRRLGICTLKRAVPEPSGNLIVTEAERVCGVIRHVGKDNYPFSRENWTLVLGLSDGAPQGYRLAFRSRINCSQCARSNVVEGTAALETV